MRDPRFRQDQWDGRYAPHVAPINRLVDSLIDEQNGRWVPYVAPYHGGVEATLMALLRDPGPMTNPKNQRVGSGFLCTENDDPTAERFTWLLDDVGLSPREVMPWNAYPWYINRAPSSAERQAGLKPLAELVQLLPSLRVVMLVGNEARDSWQRFARAYPGLAEHLPTIPARHTSPQAFITQVPGQKEIWEAEQRHAFAIAADHAHGRPTQEFITTESQVVAAFAAWLTKQRWEVQTEVGHVDVVATRGRHRIIAEAKGRTADASLDADTAYGQLLRRMGPDGAGLDTRYAIVAPESSRTALLRVPAPIRQRLDVDVYLVSVDGGVEKVDE